MNQLHPPGRCHHSNAGNESRLQSVLKAGPWIEMVSPFATLRDLREP